MVIQRTCNGITFPARRIRQRLPASAEASEIIPVTPGEAQTERVLLTPASSRDPTPPFFVGVTRGLTRRAESELVRRSRWVFIIVAKSQIAARRHRAAACVTMPAANGYMPDQTRVPATSKNFTSVSLSIAGLGLPDFRRGEHRCLAVRWVCIMGGKAAYWNQRRYSSRGRRPDRRRQDRNRRSGGPGLRLKACTKTSDVGGVQFAARPSGRN